MKNVRISLLTIKGNIPLLSSAQNFFMILLQIVNNPFVHHVDPQLLSKLLRIKSLDK